MDSNRYFAELRRMRKNYKGWDGRSTSPYTFDEGANFPMTDIENNIWSDIRYNGYPFYYQFPIGKYYADFCDPFHGLVVETDGKIHYDKEDRDNARDEYIRSVGFAIIRISGRDTYDKISEDENGNEIRTCEGLQKIKDWYRFWNIDYFKDRDQMPWELYVKWNKSIGYPVNKEKYDLATKKIEKLKQAYKDHGGIISLKELAKYL